MTASYKVKYLGKTYPSLTAIAKAFNIKYTTLISRINKGLSIKEAIELKTKLVKKEIELEGTLFSSITEACIHYNVSKNTVGYRMSSGWSVEEALGIIPRKNTRKNKINGRVYIVKNKINKKVYIGITTENINKRLRNHIKLARSNTATKNKFMQAIINLGYENFWIEILEKTKSTKRLISLEKEYIKEYDSIKTGYNTSKGGQGLCYVNGKNLEYDGVSYNSYSELSKTYGINIARMHKCFEKGIPLAPTTKNISISMTINGKKYRSLLEAAKHHNIPPKTLYQRYKKGYKDNELLNYRR